VKSQYIPIVLGSLLPLPASGVTRRISGVKFADISMIDHLCIVADSVRVLLSVVVRLMRYTPAGIPSIRQLVIQVRSYRVISHFSTLRVNSCGLGLTIARDPIFFPNIKYIPYPMRGRRITSVRRAIVRLENRVKSRKSDDMEGFNMTEIVFLVLRHTIPRFV
jgi:hypothetical protein